MARWRLREKHYLNVPGTEWEYKETDRNTGRQGRKIFHVPLFLDPDFPPDCNYPGEIIVCYDGKGQGRDIIFVGPPTPDMEPLDDEAQAISDKESPKWQHPIESLPGSYSQSLLDGFQAQIDALTRGREAQPPPAVSASQVDPGTFAAMQSQLRELMESNAQLQAQLAEMAEQRSARRI